MLKSTPDLISIIVPMYNAEKTIEKCISSIQASIYKNIEILLIDDGSKDNTVKICKEIQKRDSRVVLYTKENGGAGETRTFGLKKANGKYVGFVDSDDWIEPQMYLRLYETIEKDKLDVCFCGHSYWESDKKTFEDNIRFEKDIYAKEEIMEQLVHNCVWFPASFMKENALAAVWKGLYSMDLVRKNSLEFLNERTIYSEDSIFNFEVLCRSERVGFVRECMYNYAYFPNSLSNTHDERYEKLDKWYEYICENCKKNGIEQYVIPYLNTQYLKEFRGDINRIISNNDSRQEMLEKCVSIRKKYKHLNEIPIANLNGCSLKEKIKLKLVRDYTGLYYYVKK
ncbi:MAG: glycosyltransferase [Eubacterium sp.]